MINEFRILNYDEYKFFFIETTAACNLRCSYCYYKKTDKKPNYNVEELVDELQRFDKLIVCFLGGEPFLNHSFIQEVVMHPVFAEKKVVFAANTNGTQFDNVSSEVLSRFAFFHLSVDGIEVCNDYYRGAGTYSLILRNLKHLRKYSNAQLVARMTVSSARQIADIPALSEHFDAVYWQVNNSRNELSREFLPEYLHELEGLFEWWRLEGMHHADYVVIPFVGMCDLIMRGGMRDPDLICGAGRDHVSISLDGSVYPCPESFYRRGDEECLGSLSDFVFQPYSKKERCLSCDLLKYCGGRCAMTDDDIYCESVRQVYNMCIAYINALTEKELMEFSSHIDRQRGVAYTTEIIS